MKRLLERAIGVAVLSAFGSMGLGIAAQAATISVSTETGAAMETEFGIRADTGTRGYELAGATVTATLGDGTTETRTWSVFTNFVSGGVNGTNWSLFKNELGRTNIDVLNGQVVTKLVIDASTSLSTEPNFSLPGAPLEVVGGASLFDISTANEGEAGNTPGSAFGFPFEFVDDGFIFVPTGNVAVTYSGAVNLLGAPAVGDLFTTMSLDFTGLDGGGFSGSSAYTTDMDTLLLAGDLTPVTPSQVPLPAGLPLLIAGLGGLGLLRRLRS